MNFLLATRDSGYRSTALVLAEFIDNSLQADASQVELAIVRTKDTPFPIEIHAIDDGRGMDSDELAASLAFGGSSRFGDRSSLGRYGMGLPNGGLSRARRIDVYTWRPDRALHVWLDLDEIVSGRRHRLPAVRAVPRPEFAGDRASGTAIVLRRCDRLEYRRPSALRNVLHRDLGRIYRRFLADGLSITIDGTPVESTDPMLLDSPYQDGAAIAFGDELRYRFDTALGEGTVTVRFSELPIAAWHSLSTEEKRGRGITHGPPVSVLRASREVDRGWYFMGGKRRENYDDWWRCEIDFDPVLDELFGVTHSKQSITPTARVHEVLDRDLEPIARALNARARRAFEDVKLEERLIDAERQAARAHNALPTRTTSARSARQARLREAAATILSARREQPLPPYRIAVCAFDGDAAFDVLRERDQLILLLNARHPLTRDLYAPLALSESASDRAAAKHVALAILAAARAEEGLGRRVNRGEIERFRADWADVISTFYNA